MPLDNEERAFVIEFPPVDEEARHRASYRPRGGSILPGEALYRETAQAVLLEGGEGMDRLVELVAALLLEVQMMRVCVAALME